MNQETTGKHTKTPWELDTCGWPLIINEAASDKVVCELPMKVKGSTLYVSESEQEANAQFIVTACNHHDELVATLEDVQVFARLSCPQGVDCDLWESTFDRVESVLAKLKGTK